MPAGTTRTAPAGYSSTMATFPTPALEWALPRTGGFVLDLGGELTNQLAADHTVLAAVHGDAAPASAPVIRTKPSMLPFTPASFDAAITTDPTLLVSPVLAEVARVLSETGTLAVVEYSRDDAIPWVKRFATRLQEADPTAMRASGSRSREFLEDSPHFVAAEEKRFRRWVPVSREGLLAMVADRPAVAALDEGEKDALLADIGAIHDDAARPGEKLQLPFEVVCVRTRVDRSGLEAPAPRDDGLSIRLHF